MRHLFYYVLFVGLPLAGLLGVLRLGQRIVAPTAVHGAYAVQPTAITGLVCHRYLLSGTDSSIHLAQSGRQITATLGPAAEIRMAGTLYGSELVLEGEILPGTTPRFVACPVGDTLRLTAKVYRDTQTKRLDARLWSIGCVECGSVAFEATRPRRYEGRRRS